MSTTHSERAEMDIQKANQPQDRQPAPELSLMDTGYVYLTTWAWYSNPTYGGWWEWSSAMLGPVWEPETRQRTPEALYRRLDELEQDWDCDDVLPSAECHHQEA